MKLTETEVRAAETKQQGRKRNVAFRVHTIPALSVYCKRSLWKSGSQTKPTATLLIF